MTAPAASPQGVRAVMYAVEEVYDVVRGLVAAYVVDSGDAHHAGVGMPGWDELTPGEQLAFGKAAKDHILAISAVAIGISGAALKRRERES